ncbi:MAG: winged helix-turn-helix domain-containing protein [Candidatus Caldarchaeum sp.]
MADKPIKRLFWWLLLGTKGGPTRLLILVRLRDGPANANQLANALKLNYKTVQHHLEILMENKLVECDGGRYDVRFRLAPIVAENLDVLESIVEEALSKPVKASIAWGRSG